MPAGPSLCHHVYITHDMGYSSVCLCEGLAIFVLISGENLESTEHYSKKMHVHRQAVDESKQRITHHISYCYDSLFYRYPCKAKEKRCYSTRRGVTFCPMITDIPIKLTRKFKGLSYNTLLLD